MKRQIIFLIVILALTPWSLISGKNIYVAQKSTGTGSGADAADANSISWLNTSGSWGGGAATILPGDTVHLVGTFTSPLIVQGSGASGNAVTIFFEPGANFTSTCWSGAGAIQFNGQSWIIINGGVNGLIQNTANGTGLAMSTDSTGLAGSMKNVVIENLTITNIYRRTSALDLQRVGSIIGVSGSDITVSNCNLSDGDGILFYGGPQPGKAACSNIFFVNNRILNYNHGVAIGEGNQSVGPQNVLLSNVVIAGNYFDHSDVWDDAANVHHMDAIYLVADTYDPTVVLNGFKIYNNTFGPHMCNQSLLNTSATAIIGNYFDNPVQQIQNFVIYNNLVMAPVGGKMTWGNSFYGYGSNVWFVNNTVCGGVGVAVTGSKAYLYNNLIMDGAVVNLNTKTTNQFSTSTAPTNCVMILSNYFGGIYSDYNAFVSPPGLVAGMQLGQVGSGVSWNPGIFSWPCWKTFCSSGDWCQTWAQTHCDPHSVTGTPAFNLGTFVPLVTDVVANAHGTNLTAAFNALGIPTADFKGNPRPLTGGWSIGAFQPAALVALPTPTGFRITTNNAANN